MLIGKIAVALAILYLLVTLLFQFAPLSRRFPVLDRLGIVPRWLFFTQGVGGYTLSMEIRRRDADGRVGNWHCASLWPRRRWWHPLFFPEQIRSGILWTALDRVARRAQRGDGQAIAASLAHATLLGHLSQTTQGDEVQFAVRRIDTGTGTTAERILFTSDFHRT